VPDRDTTFQVERCRKIDSREAGIPSRGRGRDRGRPVRRLAVLVAVLVFASLHGVSGTARAPGTVEVFPLERVRRGLRAEARTVLAGVEQVPIEIEILGVVRDGIGGGVDMILGRFTGETGRFTGVAHGMSGSPVYVDGKWLGSLSYAIGNFAREPICGITPAEAMLRLRDLPGGPLPWLVDGDGAAGSGGEIRPWPTQPVVAGIRRSTLPVLAGRLAALDLPLPGVPVLAGRLAPGDEGNSGVVPGLRPGDPVAVLLSWGDLVLGATGTVTWRDGDELLAFGHPFTGAGRSGLPIAPAEIVWTVASELSSFKIANIGAPVGRLDQDRLTGIHGRVGDPPRGLPVTVSVRRPARPEVTRRAFVARDPRYVPALAGQVVIPTLVTDVIGAESQEALRVRTVVRLAGGRELASEQGASDPRGLGGIGTEIARLLSRLVRPPFHVPAIERVDVAVSTVEPEGGWRVVGIVPDRLVVRRGDRLRVTVRLEGTRGRRREETVDLPIPADALPGGYTLLVGSARDLAGRLGSLAEARRRTARSAADYLDALADRPSNLDLAVRLVLPAEGIVARGRTYPALPGTAHVLLRGRPGAGPLFRARWLPVTGTTVRLDRPIAEVAKTGIEIVPAEETAR